MKEFGRTEYDQYAYVNIESNSVLRNLFKENFDIHHVIPAIKIETVLTINAANTLINLAEIQEAPGAITSLKYIHENATDTHVLSAGSLFGVTLTGNYSC